MIIIFAETIHQNDVLIYDAYMFFFKFYCINCTKVQHKQFSLLIIPIHTSPVFSNPTLQTHRYDPSVFSQTEFAGQKCVSVTVHSFTSSVQSSPCQPGLQIHAPSSVLHASVFLMSHVHFSLQLSP